MKFKLVNIDVVDCTSDPHVVTIANVQRLGEILLKFCESDVVRKIPSVDLHVIYNKTYVWVDESGEKHTNRDVLSYTANHYSKEKKSWGDGKKKSHGKQADADKVGGLYYLHRWSKKMVDDRFKLLPDGLSGVREALDTIQQHLDDPDLREIQLQVGVIWKWFSDDDGSGNDIIIRAIEGTINFSNWDNLINWDDYPDYIKTINDMLSEYVDGNPIKATKDDDEAAANRGKLWDPENLDKEN